MYDRRADINKAQIQQPLILQYTYRLSLLHLQLASRIHRGDIGLEHVVDRHLHVVRLALRSTQHHHHALNSPLLLLLVVSVLPSIGVHVLLSGRAGQGGAGHVEHLAGMAHTSLLGDVPTALLGTVLGDRDVLVAGAVEGGGQSDELSGLGGGQLDSVEAFGVLVADELGGVVAAAEDLVAVHVAQEGDVVTQALHHVLVQCVLHQLHCARSVCGDIGAGGESQSYKRCRQRRNSKQGHQKGNKINNHSSWLVVT
jgi:hypothetical protein